MIPRARRHQHFPPLPRDLVGQQLGPHLLADGVRIQEDQARRSVAVGRAAFRLHHGEIRIGRQTEIAGEVAHHLADLLAILLRHRLLVAAEVQRGGDALGGNLGARLPHHRDASGKGRVIEMKAVDHLAAGFLVRVDPAAQHLIAGRNGDVQVRREAVGGVTADREPARRIQQEGVVGMYGGELDAVDRGVFRAAQASFISELHGGRLAFCERRIEGQPHGGILLVARVGDLGALAIGHLRDGQRIVQLEGGRAGVVVQRNEAHFGGGDEGLGGRLHFGVDGVILDSNARAALLRLGARGER